jgi:hypothetical protein
LPNGLHIRGEEVVLDVTAESEEGMADVQVIFNKLRSALAATNG